MLEALFIFVDEEVDDPIYADPEPHDVEPEIWDRIVEIVQEVAEGDLDSDGTDMIDDSLIGWRVMLRNGLSFIAVVTEVEPPQLEKYLKQLQRLYFDEVDDVRRPEREGVADVVVDVIPPWEDDAD